MHAIRPLLQGVLNHTVGMTSIAMRNIRWSFKRISKWQSAMYTA